MSYFQHVGVLVRLENKKAMAVKHMVVKEIEKYVEKVTLFEGEEDKLIGKCEVDLIVVVGGDGSFLGGARIGSQFNIPVIGVNFGHVGFLADIEVDIKDGIPTVLNKDGFKDLLVNGICEYEERTLLKSIVLRDGVPIDSFIGLNDIVLRPGNPAKMMSFDLNINQQKMSSQKSDGIIVATPTGSTAYALSAGGPIVSPALDAMVVVSINSNTLASRPVVIDGNDEVSLCVTGDYGDKEMDMPFVSADGTNRFNLKTGDIIEIKKLDKKVKVLHLKGYNKFDVYREKLGWKSS